MNSPTRRQFLTHTALGLGAATLFHPRLFAADNPPVAAPAGDAVLKLRELIVAAKVPGITKQSEIFTDAGGHGKLPVIALVTYVNFACIYRVSPVGLNDPQPELDKLSPDLKPLLQRIAWDAVTEHPMSGVTKAA